MILHWPTRCGGTTSRIGTLPEADGSFKIDDCYSRPQADGRYPGAGARSLWSGA